MRLLGPSIVYAHIGRPRQCVLFNYSPVGRCLTRKWHVVQIKRRASTVDPSRPVPTRFNENPLINYSGIQHSPPPPLLLLASNLILLSQKEGNGPQDDHGGRPVRPRTHDPIAILFFVYFYNGHNFILNLLLLLLLSLVGIINIPSYSTVRRS